MLDDRTDVTADALLRGAGLRVTATRVAVLGALRSGPHATADDVFDAIRGTLPGTSMQSVYNALGDLADAGLARRIEPAGHPGMFELRVGDNHHHVVCTGCGRVDDVDCVVGEAPCLHVPEGSGFLIETAEVTFWGVCPDCRATSEAEKPRGSR
ncbi:MAG: transcriptional repressor [Microbacterium sp. 71-36]|uniref:Fur family transcriptional regulator n=1 Tax=unclassified Microbacterium TaxID=2609290 RepID=UPI000868F24B|nr:MULTISPECIES: Fur family transcriptional regulator [unclassified Microbacterium]MBN9210048.1 transcriptional repressor [Microbacterium sp.]ODT38177.1 MAG: transcriptional repressor [Microbacterium sp. SCN 71-17]ODU51813.1 MAG: transcriptional repressor [Microbacterium sp. SCN 70-10]OJV76143.1 MAG: transcriptional repressor [Microbacterium sp. 71-36]